MSTKPVPRAISRVVTSKRVTEGAGFVVRRPFPGILTDQEADPFLLLDHFGPTTTGPGEAVGAPDHPHRGFQTVSYMLEGSFQHRDSVGNSGVLNAGDIQWMTAGRGIIHSELPGDDIQQNGGTTEGFQLWVNLPAKDKMCAPRYQDKKAAEIPDVFVWESKEDEEAAAKLKSAAAAAAAADAKSAETKKDGASKSESKSSSAAASSSDSKESSSSSGEAKAKAPPVPLVRVRVVAGESMGRKAVIDTHTPIMYLDIHVNKKGATFTQPVPETHNGFLYVYRGAGTFGSDNTKGVESQLLVLGKGGEVTITNAGDDPLKVLLIAGVPLKEPIARSGPFVMNTNAEIRQAFIDYQTGKLAPQIEGADERRKASAAAVAKARAASKPAGW